MKEICLTQGKTSLVDDTDYEWLNQFSWCAMCKHGHWYASGFVNGKHVFMHRLIANTPKEMFTDHKNNNSLDNQRDNIRVCTLAENTRNQQRTKRNNTSRFKGVYWETIRSRWVAVVYLNTKKVFLGGFESEIEAAKAYNKAAPVYHGEFANLNII